MANLTFLCLHWGEPHASIFTPESRFKNTDTRIILYRRYSFWVPIKPNFIIAHHTHNLNPILSFKFKFACNSSLRKQNEKDRWTFDLYLFYIYWFYVLFSYAKTTNHLMEIIGLITWSHLSSDFGKWSFTAKVKTQGRLLRWKLHCHYQEG